LSYVLSVSRLRVGQEAYQLSGVAQSLDDYYTGAGETPGVWIGGGAAKLGLADTVDADDLRAVLAGLAPHNGGLTPNGTTPVPHPRRAPGFDLTFKAPKSASVLYAVSDDPRVQAAIVEAGEAATRAAIGWLEREVVRVRRGSHDKAWLAANAERPAGGPRQLETSGVIAASFRHRTSRAGDPLLHWHCLVANMAEGSDGKWSAIVHPELFRNAKAAGEIFQASFRAELTASLGVEWVPGRHVHEIAGVPRHLIDGFSKRSDQIEAWLAATGTADTPAGRQAAVLATRRNKPEMEHERLDTHWKAEAIEAGWTPDDAELLVASGGHLAPVDYDQAWRLDTTVFDEHGTPSRLERLVDPDEWIGTVVRSLTADRSTFTRNDLTGAVASRLGPGASTWTLDRIVNRCIASPHLIAVHVEHQPQAWTSRELVEVEQRFITSLRTNGDTAVAEQSITDAIDARPTLGPDQAAAVSAICRSTAAVSVMIGPAGTGKTFTLDAVGAAFHASGFELIGAAPSARAALELEAGAGITSRTLQSLIRRWDTGHDRPGHGTLLVIDEAGMADIRTLEHAVTRQVAAGGRVLLVGDHHQLPEVGAGGGFAYAAAHAATVAELTINRRQRAPWEQQALAELRNGNVAAAVEQYLTNDRLIVEPTNHDMIATAVERYLNARNNGMRPVLIAGTNDLVDRLNLAVLDRLVDSGDLNETSPTTYGDGRFRIGERVVIRHNSRQTTTAGQLVDIANGQPGTITRTDGAAVTVRLDASGEDVVLGDTYLRQGGRITHGYALTAHRAQGGTWDLAISVGADGLYRESTYVAMSRGIHANTLIITDPELREIEREARNETERHDTGLDPSPTDSAEIDLTKRVSRSGAKQLAHTIDPELATVDTLSRTRSLLDLEAALHRSLDAERRATERHGTDGDRLSTRIANATYVAQHISVGCHVSPHDRHNVGVVSHLDDHSGSATVLFTSADGRQARRHFTWDELRIVDAEPSARPITDEIADAVTRLTAPLELTRAAWETDVRRGGAEPDDAHRYRLAANVLLQRETAALIAGNPPWLEGLLGQQPGDVAGATTWTDAASQITRYRLEHDIHPQTPGIGARPQDDTTAVTWDATSVAIAHARVWIASTDRLAPAWPIVPSRNELHTRRHELDDLFATVPDDCRSLIGRLQRGALDLDDTRELLEAANRQQGERQHWIIRNWPHVVEYQEINRTLATGTWGPDPALLDAVTDPAVRVAVEALEPWTRAALCAVASPEQNALSAEQLNWLSEVGDYRARLGVTSVQPVGTRLDAIAVEIRHDAGRIRATSSAATSRDAQTTHVEAPLWRLARDANRGVPKVMAQPPVTELA
jgi:conjugative relaxase-like TrwC/TraI family protein